MEYRSVNEALPALAHDLIQIGSDVPSRVGATKELTFQHFTIRNPLEREIIVPTRKANIAAQIAETAWVLAGRNDVEWLSHYLPRAAEFSDDGSTWRAGYGPRLRKWWAPNVGQGTNHTVDQLSAVVDLLREDPATRRAVMSIWDPAVDTQPSKDIPCNNWLHFLARDGVLDLHVAIRSNDLVWGWSGINQFEWSVLLEVVAAYTGLTVGRVHYSVSSLHLYERHFDKAPTYKPHSFHETAPTPRFDAWGFDLDTHLEEWFVLEEEIRTSTDTGLFASVDNAIYCFPEPMLRSWLRVLRWWWTGGDTAYLGPLAGTRLAEACRVSVQPPQASQASQASQGATVCDPRELGVTQGQPPSGADLAARSLARLAAMEKHPSSGSTDFIEDAIALHIEKDAAYGTSWKRRGEMLGILANVARKVDRLGGAETSDETSADTAMDLMIYLAKYRVWLRDERRDFDGVVFESDTADAANSLLREVDQYCQGLSMAAQADYERQLRQDLEQLEVLAMERREDRYVLAHGMLTRAYMLARHLWSKANERNASHE